MVAMQMAYLELALMSGYGLVMILAGVLVFVITKKRNASCTSKTEGRVIGHKFLRVGMNPVVLFRVDGQSLKTIRRFNAVYTKKYYRLPSSPWEPELQEDTRGNLHIRTGSLGRMKALAEELWPIGSSMTVFYNPKNPKVNFVDRPTSNKFFSVILLSLGAFMTALGIIIFAIKL